MSKFIEKLNSFSKKSAPSLGFRKSTEAVQKTSMLVAVESSGKSDEELKSLADAGAAAAIIDSASVTSSGLGKCLKNCGDMAIGLQIASAKYASAAKLITPDVDFIVFDLSIPVKAFDGKEFEAAGKILTVDSSMDASLLRTINDLYPSVNAVMIDMRVTSLTLENLMNCRKVADFTGQHVIAQVNKSLTRAELTALRDSRVKSLILPADTSAAELTRVVNDIAELPAMDRKKDQGGIALVPRIETRAAAEEDEGGDDDD
ncbi:MAG: hypothetical protein WB588_02580 [Dehalococcoidia bacterium]